MATGTVKWFSDEKGFGFITPDDQSKDLFVHHSAIVGGGYRSLAEGAKVSYEVEAGERVRGPSTSSWSSDPARLPPVTCGHAPALIDDRTCLEQRPRRR